jgi:hypothetical protein
MDQGKIGQSASVLALEVEISEPALQSSTSVMKPDRTQMIHIMESLFPTEDTIVKPTYG